MSRGPVDTLQKTEYQFADDIELSSPELRLPEKSLTYGFYEIRVRLEMNGLPDVFGENTTYIQVVQTPWLEAVLTTGAFNEAIFGEKVRTCSKGTPWNYRKKQSYQTQVEDGHIRSKDNYE